MEQKKNQKDVLIVRDEKTGEISVVAGLKKDGTPKTTAASGANQKDFLLFDKNSNPLDSFLDNFFRQCKEPKRFGFYRVAAENIEHVIDVLKDLLKNPEKNRDLLEPHHVDTSKYEQQAQPEIPRRRRKRNKRLYRKTRANKRRNKPASKHNSKPDKAVPALMKAVLIGQILKNSTASNAKRWKHRAIWKRCSATANRHL